MINRYIKFEERLQQIKLLALDVDGVLTNGALYYSAQGEAMKAFNVKDGLGIKKLINHGIILAVISARKSEIVSVRMEELGVRFVYQGVEDKLSIMEGLLEQFMLYWENVAYMGDDLTDLTILKKAGFAACPADAMPDVTSICNYTTKKEGGRGAVRELADLILRYQ